MSRREEEEEEVNAVHMVAIHRDQEEEELLVTKTSTTKKVANVKSLEGNRLRRLSYEADKLKNTTAVLSWK